MKRAHKLAKRAWLLETLERRCLMASDLQVCPLPPFLETDWSQTQQIFTLHEDPFPAKVNERIANMVEEAPGKTAALVRALQENLGSPGFYNNEAALDDLYNQILGAPDESAGYSSMTIVEPADSTPEVYLSPVELHDSFTALANDPIAQMGIDSLASQSALVIAQVEQLSAPLPEGINSQEPEETFAVEPTVGLLATTGNADDTNEPGVATPLAFDSSWNYPAESEEGSAELPSSLQVDAERLV